MLRFIVSHSFEIHHHSNDQDGCASLLSSSLLSNGDPEVLALGLDPTSPYYYEDLKTYVAQRAQHLKQKEAEKSLQKPELKISHGQIAALLFVNLISLLSETSFQTIPAPGAENCSLSRRLKEYVLYFFDQKTVGNLTPSKSEKAGNSTSSNGLLHLLVSIGIGNGFHPTIRYLSLHLVSILLSSNSTGLASTSPMAIVFNPSLRISLSHILAIGIQNLLQHYTPPTQSASASLTSYTTTTTDRLIYFYLLTLFAFIHNHNDGNQSQPTTASSSAGNENVGSCGPSGAYIANVSCYNSHLTEREITNYYSKSSTLHNLTKTTLAKLSQQATFLAPESAAVTDEVNSSTLTSMKITPHPKASTHAQYKDNIESMKLLSFVELLVWVMEKCHHNLELMILIHRMLAQLYYSYHPSMAVANSNQATTSGIKTNSGRQADIGMNGAVGHLSSGSPQIASYRSNMKMIQNLLISEKILNFIVESNHPKRYKLLSSSTLLSNRQAAYILSQLRQLEKLSKVTLKLAFHYSEKSKSLVKQAIGVYQLPMTVYDGILIKTAVPSNIDPIEEASEYEDRETASF